LLASETAHAGAEPGGDRLLVGRSREGCAHAAAEGISNVTWQTGDIQAIDHPDATFDTVISFGSFLK
jgi:hypothetical protein